MTRGGVEGGGARTARGIYGYRRAAATATDDRLDGGTTRQ